MTDFGGEDMVGQSMNGEMKQWKLILIVVYSSLDSELDN